MQSATVAPATTIWHLLPWITVAFWLTSCFVSVLVESFTRWFHVEFGFIVNQYVSGRDVEDGEEAYGDD